MRKINKIMIGSVILMVTAGCIKDKGFDSHQYGLKSPDASPVGVGFPESKNEINVSAIDNINTSQSIEVSLVNLLSDVPLSHDVHVRLALLPSMITDYNENNSPDIVALPENAYSIPSLVVTIPKGQRTAFLKLDFADAKNDLDISKTYGLGLTIESVEENGIVVASNQKNILVGVSIKNAWDGVYSHTSHIIRGGDAAKTGWAAPYERAFATAGATTVKWMGTVLWADNTQVAPGYEPIITIDETTNKVTITSSNGAVSEVALYDNRYDPASKTFYLQWTYGAGPTGPSARRFTDTAVYLRPR
jgi:hypothetical protein